MASDNDSDKITLDAAYVLDTPYDLEIDATACVPQLRAVLVHDHRY